MSYETEGEQLHKHIVEAFFYDRCAAYSTRVFRKSCFFAVDNDT